jgi:formylglycine-generating enzyme required for sulfatase activity
MKSRSWLMAATLAVAAMVALAAGTARADMFGTGGNQFNIDFVPISGATNPTSGYGIVNHDYRMGTFEITNDQWSKFTAAYGAVTGSQGGYSNSSYFTGTNVPTDSVSWYEAAQFVNWLNTSTGNQPAYKFTGTAHTGDYTFAPWASGDTGYNASDPYRNTAAKYFLPSEDEWVKAAYWNGTALQTYATKDNSFPAQGNGTSGTGWNYYNNGYATSPYGPWNVGSGSQELNGTYDMMGNDFEWMESPYSSGDYGAGSSRGLRGGLWDGYSGYLASSYRNNVNPSGEGNSIGFRVASVPEPGSLMMTAMIAVTGLLYYWRKHV